MPLAGNRPGSDRILRIVQQCRRFAVEAQDVQQHAVERWPQQVAALGEQRVERCTVVFEAAAAIADAETHVAGLGLDTEFVQQRDEIRIGDIVEHDEPGVHGTALAACQHVDGIGVAADAAVGLEDRDVMPLGQPIGRDVAGDAGADDGDLHGRTSCGHCCGTRCKLRDVVTGVRDYLHRFVVIGRAASAVRAIIQT